jgi:murein endopeptidase
VAFPAQGPNHFTWDAILHRSPNRRARRYGTDRTVRAVLRSAARYRRGHPGAPRVGVADLSLREGGPFGVEYGGLGHTTHQNGLDVDVLYPRKDRRDAEARSRGDVDVRLAQALLDEFVRAGAVSVTVDPELGLKDPRGVVQAMPYHETHMHVQVRRR